MFNKMNWKIGNSTLRNPKKILEAFKIFAELFIGKKYNASFFIDNLNEHPMFNYRSKSSYIQANCIRAIFRELGFITINHNKEQITPIGEKLLKQPDNFSHILIKQLSKMQYNNGEKTIKPFLIFSQFMNELIKKDIYSITKDEFNLFILTCLDYKHIKRKVNALIRFRTMINQWGKSEGNKYKQHLIHLTIKDIYENELAEKTNQLTTILNAYSPIELFYNHHLLDELFASKNSKSLSKKAYECKKAIINHFFETNSVEKTAEVYTDYLAEIKRHNLLSDSNITLNYLEETGLVSINNKEVELNNHYNPVTLYITKHNKLYSSKDEYVKHHCYYVDVKLNNKIRQVKLVENAKSVISYLRYNPMLYFLFSLMYTNQKENLTT